MHILSKKDLSSDELGAMLRSSNSIVVQTANGEVQTNEEAQVHVYDLHLFVAVQFLEENLLFNRLENSAMTTDFRVRGSAIKNHG